MNGRGPMTPVSYTIRPSEYAPYLLVSVVFVAAGAWMVAEGDGWPGWAIIAFFGLGVAWFAYMAVWLRLVISDAGVDDRTLGAGPVAWEHIVDAQVMDDGGHPYAALVVREAEVYLRRSRRARRRAVDIGDGLYEWALNTAGLRADPASVVGVIRAQIAARGAP